MADFSLGMDAKLYFCAAGVGGTPVWTELTNVKNNTLNLKKGESDVTTRGNSGWRAMAGTLKEGSIEFEMVRAPNDAGFAAIQAAWFSGDAIGIACMSGDITAAGSEGLIADCAVLDFSREEPLEEAITHKVTIKPTFSATPPQWVTIEEGGS